jgi:hypothetical protein
VQLHGQALLDANLDLLELTIASIDGEKDPRCLLASFAAVQTLLDLYQRQPEISLHTEKLKVHMRCRKGCREYGYARLGWVRVRVSISLTLP